MPMPVVECPSCKTVLRTTKTSGDVVCPRCSQAVQIGSFVAAPAPLPMAEPIPPIIAELIEPSRPRRQDDARDEEERRRERERRRRREEELEDEERRRERRRREREEDL